MYYPVLMFLTLFPLAVTAAEFVGSTACAGCHQQEAAAWQQSDHFRAMLPATPEHVYGEFDGRSLVFHGEKTSLSREGERYQVQFENDDRGALEISYTFGHRPLQQYLVELAGGRLQALNVAWDSREASAGGQRWFHLRDSLAPDSPFRWDRHFQNWNSRCAECHSTDVKKGFDAATSTYETTFAEVNVGCEACHGPGGDHAGAAPGAPRPAMINAAQTLRWQFGDAAPVASASGDPADSHINMCGGCHSRRAIVGPVAPGADYFDQYALSLLEPGLYHPDGQILDEVFVLGSFLQSRMHAEGVTCMNCHNAHTGQLRFPDNRLCAQCHNPVNYDVTDHHGHVAGTPGSACVDCHMPETTYMMVDARADHRFGIPDPRLSESHGVPNACNGCHEDRTAAWAVSHIDQSRPPDPYADLVVKSQRLDPLAVPEATAYIRNSAMPEIRRASLLAMMPVTEPSLQLASRLITAESTLLRMAAARHLGAGPLPLARMTLPAALADARLAVRMEAFRGLIPLFPEMSEDEFARMTAPLAEYRDSLSWSVDTPGGLTELARLEGALGNGDAAIQALIGAIELEPQYVPANLNLADRYREVGDEAKALELLQRTVSFAPDSGGANHSLGLALVRSGRTQEAIQYFRQAIEQSDAQPRFDYVLAVALDAIGQTSESVKVLSAASRRWPNQYQLLLLEVMYREKTGLLSGIKSPLRALARIAPEDPQVAPRIDHYRIFE